MNAGWQLDDFLEIVECLPQEIKSSFSQMTEKDKEFDVLNRSLLRQRQKLLGEAQAATPTVSKLLDKIVKDEQFASSLLDEKVSICQNLISTLEAYMPILQAEIQKNSGSIGGGLHQPPPIINSPIPSMASSNVSNRKYAQTPPVRDTSPLVSTNRSTTPTQFENRRSPSVDPNKSFNK